MPNASGNAYALTVLCPIRKGHLGEVAYSDEVRSRLEDWNFLHNSPMARVPQTYLCRYFVLDDVFTEARAGSDLWGPLFDVLSIFSDHARRRALPREDHLQSKYLVFSCNFHGALDDYLRRMWLAIGDEIRHVWEFCYAFDRVTDADSFIAYIKRCQLDVSLFFVGATDEPLEQQLKSLYIKQEFAKFAIEHQGLPAAQLQKAYQAFMKRIAPDDLSGPAWTPGQYSLRQERSS